MWKTRGTRLGKCIFPQRKKSYYPSNKCPLCMLCACIKKQGMVTRDGRLGTSSAAMLILPTPTKANHCHLVLEKV